MEESEVSVSEAARMDTSTLGLHIYGDTFLLYDFAKMDLALTEYDYDEIDEAVVGVVETRYNGKHDAVEVDSLWGTQGYGPLLYLIAMQLAKPRKLITNRGVDKTSDSAKRVWKEFYDGRGKNSVEIEELANPDPNKEDFLNHAMTNKVKIDIRGMESKNNDILSNDRYGEKKDTLEEAGDSKLKYEMEKIYVR